MSCLLTVSSLKVIGQFLVELDEGFAKASSITTLIEAHATALGHLQLHALLGRAHAELGALVTDLLTLCVQAAHCHFSYQSGGAAKLVVAQRPAILRSKRKVPRHRAAAGGLASSDSNSEDEEEQVVDAFAEAQAARRRTKSADAPGLSSSLSSSLLHVSPLSIAAAATASFDEMQEMDFERQLATLEEHVKRKVEALKRALKEVAGARAAMTSAKKDEEHGSHGRGSAETRELLQRLSDAFMDWK